MKTKFLIPITFQLCILAAGCNTKNQSEKIQPMETSTTTDKNESSFKSGYSDVNGIKMYYEIYGNGAPLVLIHGGGSTIETTFGRIIPVLSTYRQVIAVELQAHGHSSDRDTDLSFEQDADDVAALLKNIHIEEADFFGFSNGGNTVLQIALRHPHVTKKIIVASALLKRNGTSAQFWEFMKQAKLEQMPQQYKDAFLKITNDTTRLQTMHNKCAKRMNTFKDMSDEQIKSIHIPVLLINGDADVATSEHMLQVSRLIPNSNLAIIPGSHGEYMGEIMSYTSYKGNQYPVVPILERFLK